MVHGTSIYNYQNASPLFLYTFAAQCDHDSIIHPQHTSIAAPRESWLSPDVDSITMEATTVTFAKSSEKSATNKPALKTNGFQEEHNNRGNGYISITGTTQITAGMTSLIALCIYIGALNLGIIL